MRLFKFLLASMVVLMCSRTAFSGRTLLEGKFKMTKVENMDAWLDVIKLSPVLRPLIGIVVPIVTVTRECPDEETRYPLNSKECTWTILTETVVQSHSITFKLGTPVEDKTLDGREVVKRFTMPGKNIIREVQKLKEPSPDGKPSRVVYVRKFNALSMDLKMEANDVIAYGKYERILSA